MEKKKVAFITGIAGQDGSYLAELLLDFNDLMISLNKYLESKNSYDFKESIKYIFFDEFQVTNIADAMILGHLFEEFFKNNILIVLTSNSSPEDLYKEGLQRELFIPFINLIKNNSLIHHLSIDIDYRTRSLK